MVDEDALRARYSLVEVDDEGVLIDRDSGAVFRLNRSACAVWRSLLTGESLPSIAAMIARRFRIAPDVAERDTRSALEQLPAAAETAATSPADKNTAIDCRWEATSDGYAFRERGVITCEIDGHGTSLRLPPGARPTEAQARGYIRSVVARVLALRGVHLLHASAVEIDGALTVFTGPSGAGKTTTARAFAGAGARLISEDLLVLAPSPADQRAIAGGEATIRGWVATHAARLADQPTEAVPCEGLDGCSAGDSLPIVELLVIDEDRRVGDQIQSDRLSPIDALVALMESVYFASADPRTWDARFERLRQLVGATPTSRATMPRGLTALEGAVRSFHKEMIAS